MDEIVLTCCGQIVPAPPVAVVCPACGTRFTESQVEHLQMQELAQIPVVDLLRAQNMLKEDSTWILERRTALGAMSGAHLSPPVGHDGAPHGYYVPEIVFPIAAVRRFATENNFAVTPRPIENGVLWVDRPVR